MDILDRDYVKDALNLLLPQFDESKNLQGLLKGWLDPTIEWQNAVKELYSAYNIFDPSLGENTYSKQLEMIAKLLNVSRDGVDDKLLRYKILSQIAINNADGTGDSFISLLSLVLGEDIRFDVLEVNGAPEVRVSIYSPSFDVTEDLIKAILPIGVLGNFLTVDEEFILFYPVEVRADGSHEPDWGEDNKTGILSEVDDVRPDNMANVAVVPDVTYFG